MSGKISRNFQSQMIVNTLSTDHDSRASASLKPKHFLWGSCCRSAQVGRVGSSRRVGFSKSGSVPLKLLLTVDQRNDHALLLHSELAHRLCFHAEIQPLARFRGRAHRGQMRDSSCSPCQLALIHCEPGIKAARCMLW